MDFCATHSLKAAAGERGLAVHFASPIHFDSLHSWWQEDTVRKNTGASTCMVHVQHVKYLASIPGLHHIFCCIRGLEFDNIPLEFTSLAVLHLHTWNLLSICEYTYTQQTSIQATYSPIWLDCTHGCRGIIKSPYRLHVDWSWLPSPPVWMAHFSNCRGWEVATHALQGVLPVCPTWVTEQSWQEMK